MNDRRKRFTIKDVALRAEVSPATVSLVLNGKTSAIPDATRRRVREAVKELNYSSDYIARAMVTGRTNIIGIVIPDISNAFFAETVRHIQVELAAQGYDIILCNSEEKAENDIRYIGLLAGRSVDGLILAPSAEAFAEGYAERIPSLLSELRIPCLFLDRYYSDAAPCVAADNAESGYVAAKYLIESGHKKLGAVAGPLILNSSGGRLRGLRRALAEKGLSLPAENVFEGKYDFETGLRGGEFLISKGVTAIFTFSDMQAYGVYESAKRAGLHIPEDLSVVGFDDDFYSSILGTPLTTMRQPIRKIAEAACGSILRLVRGEERVESIRIPAELIVRKSVKRIG